MHVTANVTEHSCVFRSVPSRWREWQANDWTHLQAPQLPGRKYVLWDNQLLQLASSSLSSFLRYSKAGRRLPGPTARQEAAQTDRPAGGCPDRQPGRRLPRPTGRQEAVQTDRPAGGCQDRQAGRRLSRPTGRQEAAQTDRPAGGCPDRQAGRRLPRPTGRQEAVQTDRPAGGCPDRQAGRRLPRPTLVTPPGAEPPLEWPKPIKWLRHAVTVTAHALKE